MKTPRFLSFIALSLAVLLSLSSCSKEQDEETELYATLAEVTGSWIAATASHGYFITFNSDGTYSYEILNVIENEWVRREKGSFAIKSGILYVTDVKQGIGNSSSSTLNEGEIYWKDSSKKKLHVTPIGYMTRREQK